MADNQKTCSNCGKTMHRASFARHIKSHDVPIEVVPILTEFPHEVPVNNTLPVGYVKALEALTEANPKVYRKFTDPARDFTPVSSLEYSAANYAAMKVREKNARL